MRIEMVRIEVVRIEKTREERQVEINMKRGIEKQIGRRRDSKLIWKEKRKQSLDQINFM